MLHFLESLLHSEALLVGRGREGVKVREGGGTSDCPLKPIQTDTPSRSTVYQSVSSSLVAVVPSPWITGLSVVALLQGRRPRGVGWVAIGIRLNDGNVRD